MIQQTTIKNSSRQALAGLALIAAMLMACSSEHEMQNDLMPGGSDTTKVFTLNALSIDVSDDNAPFTRTTSRGDSWEDGDVVYVRNSSTGDFTPYVYHQETGLFLVRNDATAIQFTSVGTASQEVEAYFRGDVVKPLTPTNASVGWVASDYTDVALATQFTALQDQSTDAKVQQSEFLYTEQDLVHRLDGTVGITLKHQVARITVKVTIDTNIQEFLTEAGAEVTNTEGTHTDYTSTALTISNDPDDKIYYVGTPAFSGTEMGFTLNTKLSEPIVGHRLVQAGENIATGVTSGETGTATYTALILPQEVGNQQLQDFIFIRVKGKGKDDSQAITYKYSLPATVTFEKGKNYTFNLQLTDGASYTNVFQDELSPSDLGKILCNDGSLIPTVAEAIDKGYTPLGHLVYYTGSKGSYTGMCMSYEDINTNNAGNPTSEANSTAKTLCDAAVQVYYYKDRNWTYTNSDGTTATYTKPNPGGEAWCSEWFIPTTDQWKLVEKMADNNDATRGKTSAGSARYGVQYAMQAIQNMQSKIVGADGTTASYTYTKDAVPSGSYWTSTITGVNAATSEKTDGTETTSNVKTVTCNTRAFFYFDAGSSPKAKTTYTSNSRLFLTPLLEATADDIGKVIIVDTNKKGYVYTYKSTISTDDYPKGQYLDGYALLASVAGMSGISNPTGESGYTHGLAVRCTDLGGYAWHTNDNNQTDESSSYFPNYIEYYYNNGNYVYPNNVMSESIGGYAKTKYRQASAYPAFYNCWQLAEALPTASGATDHWFLPTLRQLAIVYDAAGVKSGQTYRMSSYYSTNGNGWNKWTANTNGANEVSKFFDNMFTNCGAVAWYEYGNYYWTSSEASFYQNNGLWYYYGYMFTKYTSSAGNTFLIVHGGKASGYQVRPFYAF